MIWMFLLTFSIIFTSFLCGFLVSDLVGYKDDGHIFFSPLGLLIVLGLLQVVYYPFQYYNLSTKGLYLATLALFILIFVLSLFKIKKILKHLLELKVFYKELIFGLIIFGVFTYIYYYVKFPTRTDDLYFYIPYIIDKTRSINLSASIYNQYDFQGFYDFVGFLVFAYNKLVSLNLASQILPVGVIGWVPSLLCFWFLAFTIVDTMVWVRQFIKNKLVPSIVAFILFIYTIGAYWYLQTPYIGNSFRRLSLVIIFYLILLLLKKYSLPKLLVLEIGLISIISQTSTGFFFSAFILYGLTFYYASINEREYLNKIIILSIGPMIFASLAIVYVLIYINSLYGLYAMLVLFNFDNIIEKFLNKFYRVLIILIPLLFGIYTRLHIFKMPEFNISYFNISPYFFDKHAYEGIENLFEFGIGNIQELVTSIFCIVTWVYLIYFIYKNFKKKDYFGYLSFHCLIIFITFFNPWVITFVMSYMTNVVYFRIYDLFFNILTITLFLSYGLDRLKGKYLYASSIFVFVLYAAKVLKNQTWMFMGFNDENYSSLYHTSSLEIEVLDRFEKEVLNSSDEPVIVASQIYSSEAFTNAKIKNIKKNLYTYDLDDPSNQAKLQRVLYRYEPGLPEIKANYLEACYLLEEEEVGYVILDAQYNRDLENGIGYCGEKVLEVGQYRVFETHYDWLSWSKPLE